MLNHQKIQYNSKNTVNLYNNNQSIKTFNKTKFFWTDKIIHFNWLNLILKNQTEDHNYSFFKSGAWLAYKHNKINLLNKKKKFLAFKPFIKCLTNSNIKSSLTQTIYSINSFLPLSYKYNFVFYQNILNFKQIYKFNYQIFFTYYILKYTLSHKNNWLISTNFADALYLTNSKIKKYKLVLYYSKVILKTKIKFIQWGGSPQQTPNRLNWDKNQILSLMYQQYRIKFLWRSKFTYNLLIVYFILLTFQNLTKGANILITYLSLQFRILFSKHEQKFLMYLILNFNKYFIASINISKFNYYNRLLLLQLIITGRWQRKRWVTPFPKTYLSSPYNYNKFYKKLHKNHYFFSFAQQSVWTRKGNIGLRVFILYNRK